MLSGKSVSLLELQTSRYNHIFDLTFVLCSYFTRNVGQEIEKKIETKNKVLTNVLKHGIIDEKSFV